MQNRTKILIATATPLAVGAALAGLVVAAHQPASTSVLPTADSTDVPWRDTYLDRLVDQASPTRAVKS